MLQGNAPTSFNPQRLGVASVAGRRAVNEDAWATPPAGMDVAAGEFYVVADGVGGQQRGDVAAQTAVAVAFRAFYERRAAGDGPPAALLAAVETANREVYQLAHSLGVDQMGCTLAAALLVGGVGWDAFDASPSDELSSSWRARARCSRRPTLASRP